MSTLSDKLGEAADAGGEDLEEEFHVDFSGVEKREAVTGRFNAEIVGVQAHIGKTSGNPGAKLRVKLTEGPRSGLEMDYYWTFVGNNWSTQRDMEDLALPEHFKRGDVVGRRVMASVRPQPSNPAYMEVTRLEPED